MSVIEAIQNGSAQLLDVRGSMEWKMGHAKGATHIAVNDLMAGKLGNLDKSKPVYIYCASGGRAGMAEQYLRSQGFDATNIGGLSNWAGAGGAVER